MQIYIFQKGFNYSQDGDGNRLVYHLQGCNMHCPWCSNPEGMVKEGTHLSYEVYEVEEIVQEAKRSQMLFFDGGGVTLSGGEATLQFEAVYTLLERLQEEGIHTAIETNASHPKLEELFPLIDLCIMDFKHYNAATHQSITGLSNQIIKDNIKKALAKHPRVLIRIPLIKGFNDKKKDAEKFAAFFKSSQTAHAVFECLPYHEYGKVKWEKCGMDYKMTGAYISSETLAVYQNIFRENNLLMINT